MGTEGGTAELRDKAGADGEAGNEAGLGDTGEEADEAEAAAAGVGSSLGGRRAAVRLLRDLGAGLRHYGDRWVAAGTVRTQRQITNGGRRGQAGAGQSPCRDR